MAKSKYSPALFEVINRQRTAQSSGKLALPKWWKSKDLPDQQPPGEPAPAEESAVVSDPAAEAAPTQEAAAASEESVSPVRTAPVNDPAPSDPVEPSAPTEYLTPFKTRAVRPVVAMNGGRIELSLTPAYAAVIAGVFLLVLPLVSYQLGRGLRGSGKADQPDALTQTLNQAPNPGVLDSPEAKASAKTGSGKANEAAARQQNAQAAGPKVTVPVAGNDASFVQGLHYVVLDRYPTDARKSAEFVQKWLATNQNIQTALFVRGGTCELWSKQGFDWSKPDGKQACEEFVKRIRSLGKECSQALIKADLPVYRFASPQPFKK